MTRKIESPMSVKRFDRVDFQKAEVTVQGFLRAPAYATRIGVLTYRKPDGSVLRELRSPSEVFQPESMKTLAGVPITNQHPKVKGDLLTPANAANFTVGYTGDSVERAEERFLKVTATVIDAGMIRKAGDYELSCGYTCDLANEPGIFEGEAYDVIQRNIVYNHLAMVPKGRAGDEVRIHLDADDAISTDCEGAKTMAKMKIGDKEFDAAPELAAAHEEMMKKHADAMGAMQKKMDDMEAKMGKSGEPDKEAPVANQPPGKPEENKDGKDGDKMPPKAPEAKMDAMQARIDALEAALKGAPASADFGKAVSARVALISTAREIVDTKKVSLDAMDDISIMRECIKADSASVNLDGKSDDYVKAYFDIVSARRGAAGSTRLDMGEQIIKARQGAEVPSVEKARMDARDRALAQSKKPVGINMASLGK